MFFDPDRLGDVLELGRAQIADGEIKPRLHLTIGVLGETDSTGLGYAFKARRDIDAIAHQVAVALLDHVPQVDAYSKFDAALGRQASVALDHPVLYLDGPANGINNAPELDEDAISCPLDNAAVVQGDSRIDQITPERPLSRDGAFLVGAGKPTIAGHIRR